jgi:hypothetical protein
MTSRGAAIAALVIFASAFPCGLAAGQTPASAQGIPRTSDGRPDFSGVWQVLNTAAWDIEGHHAQEGVPPGLGVVVGGPVPYQTWALERRKENYANRMTEDTDAKCFMPGVPRITYMPHPFQIVQTPAKTTIFYEYIHTVRHIYTDGSPHPRGPIEWWMGDSRGRGDGGSTRPATFTAPPCMSLSATGLSTAIISTTTS